jgi:hypothetical protein
MEINKEIAREKIITYLSKNDGTKLDKIISGVYRQAAFNRSKVVARAIANELIAEGVIYFEIDKMKRKYFKLNINNTNQGI